MKLLTPPQRKVREEVKEDTKVQKKVRPVIKKKKKKEENSEYELKVQGIILTKIKCEHEQVVRAERENKESVPLLYGSLHIGVLALTMNNTFYKIKKESDNENISELRLMLEVSFKYKDGDIIKQHQIINELKTLEAKKLKLNNVYLRKDHICKTHVDNNGRRINTYFVKVWADELQYDYSKPKTKRRITPPDVLKEFNFNHYAID